MFPKFQKRNLLQQLCSLRDSSKLSLLFMALRLFLSYNEFFYSKQNLGTGASMVVFLFVFGFFLLIQEAETRVCTTSLMI